MTNKYSDYVIISSPKTVREHTIQFIISPDAEQYPQHEYGRGIALYYTIENIISAGIPYSQSDRIRPIRIKGLSEPYRALFSEAISDSGLDIKDNPCIAKRLKYRDVYNGTVLGNDD